MKTIIIIMGIMSLLGIANFIGVLQALMAAVILLDRIDNENDLYGYELIADAMIGEYGWLAKAIVNSLYYTTKFGVTWGRKMYNNALENGWI